MFVTRARKTNRAGFTLIELLIVFAILGILASLAIPAFLKYKKSGSDASAKTSVKSAYTSAVAYMTEKGKSWSQAAANTNSLAAGGWKPTEGITTSANGTTIRATPGAAGNYAYAVDSSGSITTATP